MKSFQKQGLMYSRLTSGLPGNLEWLWSRSFCIPLLCAGITQCIQYCQVYVLLGTEPRISDMVGHVLQLKVHPQLFRIINTKTNQWEFVPKFYYKLLNTLTIFELLSNIRVMLYKYLLHQMYKLLDIKITLSVACNTGNINYRI